MDYTPINPLRLSAKEITERNWQLSIEAKAQAAEDAVKRPVNNQMSRQLAAIAVTHTKG